MSADHNIFVGWEEHIVNPEKGSRQIHFFLKKKSGDLVLAVVGTERWSRHILYTVSDEYVKAVGCDGSIHAGKQWKTRRDTVDWLTSNVSSDSAKAFVPGESSAANKRSLPPHLPHHRIPRIPEVQKSDIVWSGVASICTKQLSHYPAFVKNGATIPVHSFVFVVAEGESHLVGYLKDLYENSKGQKMVRVRWFHQSHEVGGIISNLNPRPREVFKTSNVQVIGAECIDSPATVLTPKHYEKCSAAISQGTSGIFMCSRQFKNNTVKPFDLTKLQGYWNQQILTSLGRPCVSNNRIKDLKSNRKEFELTCDDSERRGVKRNMSFRKTQKLEAAYYGLTNSNAGSMKENCKLKLSDKASNDIEDVGSPLHGHTIKVGDTVETLCHESGFQGCWFKCKVLKLSEKHLKVKYVDVQNADGSGNREEWVPASTEATPDKLGIRCQGRLSVRPCPPQVPLDHSVRFGEIVDAWWADGWWEGVVVEGESSGNKSIKVYVPGTNRVLTVRKEEARMSREWMNGTWVELKATSEDCQALTIDEKVGIMMQAMQSNEASTKKDGNTGDGGACDEVEPAPDTENPKKVGLVVNLDPSNLRNI